MDIQFVFRQCAALGAIAIAGIVLSPPTRAQTVTTPASIAQDSEHRHRHRHAPLPAVPNPNCTIIVPADPLSAAGLATPYQLVATDPGAGACHEANHAQSAFVQAAILDPATGSISIYNPLVVDRGTTPAVAPAVPTLAAGAHVGIWFGYNGSDLTLRAASGGALEAGHCVNGLPGSVFGQFAYCNARAFFAAARVAIRDGRLKVPPLGMARDGKPCPSVRDFFIVDQDQSDNLPTMYLAGADGRTAQLTPANRAGLAQATTLGNPSDNRLTDIFVDGAFGCSAWKAPDLADPGQSVPALALNELQAQFYQQTPVALVPSGDPMTQNDGASNLSKVNLYRIGVDQPVVTAEGDADTARYCRQIVRVEPERLSANRAVLSLTASPDAAAADSLFTFLAQRLVTTYQILDCQALLKRPLPVSVATNSTGVAVSASIDLAALKAALIALEPWKAQDDLADSAARTR